MCGRLHLNGSCTVTDRRCTCGRVGVAHDQQGGQGGRAQPSALLCRPLQRYWNVNVMQITAGGEGKEVWRVNKLQKLFTCGRGGLSPPPSLMSIAAL